HRSDGALRRGRNALLQRAHVGRERRLITDGRGNAAEQGRDLRAGLREAEDVVDEKQHVLALVAEVFGNGETGQADAGTRAGRLVHLAVDQRAFGAGRGAVVFLRVFVDPRLDHLVIKVVAFARALADAGEYRIPAVRLRNVIDQLHDDDGLADAGAAEQADLAALGVRREQIDDLDAGDENCRLGRLVGEGRRRLMDRAALLVRNRTSLVDRFADHVDDAAQSAVADRHRDRLASIDDLLPTHEALGRVHCDSSHGRLAEMLRDFEHETVTLILGLERIENGRQMLLEMHVDDGADDLGNVPNWIGHGWSLLLHRDTGLRGFTPPRLRR